MIGKLAAKCYLLISVNFIAAC